jgi:hypothetical protein
MTSPSYTILLLYLLTGTVQYDGFLSRQTVIGLSRSRLVLLLFVVVAPLSYVQLFCTTLHTLVALHQPISQVKMGWKPTDPSGTCILTNNSGFIYEELTCLYPKWASFVSSWELAYDPGPLRDWMVANPWVPILAVVLYGVGIVFGRNYFREKQAWSWRRTLAAWNFSLSLFSAIGFCRCAVQLVHNLTHYSLHDNLCNDPEHHYGSGSSGIWIQFFVLSKFPYVYIHLSDDAVCMPLFFSLSFSHTCFSLYPL